MSASQHYSSTALQSPRSSQGRCAPACTAAPGGWPSNTCRCRKFPTAKCSIRVAACGICGTDIKKIQHGFVAAPQIFGHEVAGTVVAVGRGVSRWKLGDRVVSFHHVPCGHCFYCERRLFSQCPAYKKVGLTAGFDPNGGGFAEYVRAMPWIAERGMVEIPAGVSFEEATFVEPVNTCLKAVEKARVAAGETVLVMGQGPIGLLLMMLGAPGRRHGAHQRPMPERRAVERASGRRGGFDPSAADLQAEVRARTEGRGADAVLVAVPLPAALAEALALARPGRARAAVRAERSAHEDRISRRRGRRRGKGDSRQLQRRRGSARGVRAAGVFPYACRWPA